MLGRTRADLGRFPEDDRVFGDAILQVRHDILVHREEKIDTADEGGPAGIGNADFCRIAPSADARHVFFARENPVALALEHRNQKSFYRLYPLSGRSS